MRQLPQDVCPQAWKNLIACSLSNVKHAVKLTPFVKYSPAEIFTPPLIYNSAAAATILILFDIKLNILGL